MTMTSADSGLPFPLKKGQLRQGSASGDRAHVKGSDSQQKGINDRESLSIEAVRDYGNEVTSFYHAMTTQLSMHELFESYCTSCY